MSQKLYFKITNEKECHHGFQYINGKNILKEEFNNDPKATCVSGRFYFTEPKYIVRYLNYGIYLREVYLPTDDPNFQMIKDPDGDKYGANMIILGEKRDLRDLETWKYMVSKGVDIHINNDYALRRASVQGHFKIVQYLVENGANLHAEDYCALRLACNNNHFEVVKYLIENGANIHANDDYALIRASMYGQFEMVQYLVENGANLHAKDDYALRLACRNGHFEVVKYLIENGANVNSKPFISRKPKSFCSYIPKVLHTPNILRSKIIKIKENLDKGDVLKCITLDNMEILEYLGVYDIESLHVKINDSLKYLN
ncbi:repeat protein [Moumouvirus goulette]|uniref:Repeat protein n=1 Tax=Moumouvirus goulette TaxID=1247379 RepID=M1NLE3_9VIRU|nr:repeat protein [Moumouvirus goulette]AGF84830.1 repeat protein [Moumouvirus goulette]